MVNTTNTRQSDNLCRHCRPGLDFERFRGDLFQRQVATIPVGVGDIVVKEPVELCFVEDDHVVEQLSTHGGYPALRDAVLPRRPPSGAHNFHAPRFKFLGHDPAVLAVPVKDQVTRCCIERKALPVPTDDCLGFDDDEGLLEADNRVGDGSGLGRHGVDVSFVVLVVRTDVQRFIPDHECAASPGIKAHGALHAPRGKNLEHALGARADTFDTSVVTS